MWYVKIKVFLIIWATFGPYADSVGCQSHLNQMRNEGMQRYSEGERVTFMGKEVNPKNVTMICSK